MYDPLYLTNTKHAHTHTGTFTLQRAVPVMCVCILVNTTDSAKVRGRKGGWAFEHYSTDPGLLCDCGQLTAEDVKSPNMNDKIVLGVLLV